MGFGGIGGGAGVSWVALEIGEKARETTRSESRAGVYVSAARRDSR